MKFIGQHPGTHATTLIYQQHPLGVSIPGSYDVLCSLKTSNKRPVNGGSWYMNIMNVAFVTNIMIKHTKNDPGQECWQERVTKIEQHTTGIPMNPLNNAIA